MTVNSIWVSTDLVLANTKYGETERILLMTGDSVDLIEAIADVAGTVDVYDLHFSTLKRLKHYIRKPNVTFHDDVYPGEDAAYDTAIVFVPKGRDFGRAQLWTAMNALKEGGDLYLVGPNKGGAKSLIKDATQLFGTCTVLDYKKSHRIAHSKKTQAKYAYPSEWGSRPDQQQQISVETALGALEVVTQPGIFSWNRLDDGTAFLLEQVVLRDAQTVLDVGCGYGIIGSLLAARCEHVTMVDNNLLAVACAQATVDHHHLDNVRVLASDVYSELGEERYDMIISNPPFHRTFDVYTNVPHKLIQRAPDHLVQGGQLVLVANEFLKYEAILAETFKQSGIRQRNSKFKVLDALQ